MKTSTMAAGVTGIVILILLVIIFVPLLTIWSLNTLFGLKIAYTLQTWFAALVLSATVCGTSTNGGKK